MRLADLFFSVVLLLFKGRVYQKLCFGLVVLSLIALVGTLYSQASNAAQICSASCLLLSLGLSLIPTYIKGHYISTTDFI